MKKTLAFIYTMVVALSLFYGQSASAQEDMITVVYDEFIEESNEGIELLSTQSSSNSYQMIQSALLAGETEGQFDTTELSYMEVSQLTLQVLQENPDIMYLHSWSVWSNGKIEFTYSIPAPLVHTNQQLLQAEVNTVLASIIEPGFTDFDKVKAIHDYLALNTAYDYDNFLNDIVPADSYTAFGAFINGVAVCDGYTKAAQILMNRLGIENHYVVGYGNGGLHSWNLVQLDGHYYFMDITWDDPVPNKPNHVGYSYFLVTSDQLKKDHQWVEANWPTATSTIYNYFNEFNKKIEVNGYYYFSSNLDDSKLYKIAKDGTDKQQINDVRAPYFAINGDWIYFSNYSHGGYLFKMKTDGSALEELNTVHSTDISIEGNLLTYLDNTTNQWKTMMLETATENPVIPNGTIVESDKMWTVTFNNKIDKTSDSIKTVTVTSEDGKSIKVTFDFDSTETKLLIHAPKGGYTPNTNYVLTVENVKSQTGQVQKAKKVHHFYVN